MGRYTQEQKEEALKRVQELGVAKASEELHISTINNPPDKLVYVVFLCLLNNSCFFIFTRNILNKFAPINYSKTQGG